MRHIVQTSNQGEMHDGPAANSLYSGLFRVIGYEFYLGLNPKHSHVQLRLSLWHQLRVV